MSREIYPVAWRFRLSSSGDVWHLTSRELVDMPKHYTVQPLCKMDTVQELLDEIDRLRKGKNMPPPPPPVAEEPPPKRQRSTAAAELIRPKDAQKMLGIGRSTFYLWVKEGRLKTVKLSERSVAVKRQELQRFMDSLR